MPLIQWTDTYSVKIKEIDNQHKVLIRLINELNDAMRVGKGRAVLENILHELINYTTTHFTTEERLFLQYNYPAAAQHKLEHGNFVRQVSKFRQEFENSQLGLSVQVMEFLSTWLKNHIQQTDKQYSAFFNQKGVE